MNFWIPLLIPAYDEIGGYASVSHSCTVYLGISLRQTESGDRFEYAREGLALATPDTLA